MDSEPSIPVRSCLAAPSEPQEPCSSSIGEDHGEADLGLNESAHIWRHPGMPGVELFHGTYRKYEFARHFHSVPAIGVVDRGSMRTYCRRANHHLAAGSVLLLNPGEVHAPGPAGEAGWSFRVFFFENTAFEAHSGEVAGKVIRFPRPFVQDRVLAAALLRLHRGLEQQRSTLEIDEALLGVFGHLAEHQASATADRSGTEKDAVNRAKEYMTASYARNVSLAELAAVAHLSPYHLVRTFHREVGLPPHAFLIQVRIEAAKRLLRSGRSISEVASSTGFTDQSHLTRQFKRLTGVTPSQYRPFAA